MTTSTIKVHSRSENATLSRVGNDRGAVMDVVFSSRAKGFTPLEVQAASLAACMDVSLRIAAQRAWLDRLGALTVSVAANKAEDAPSRLALFEISVQFDDPLDPALQASLAAEAEKICTISNTLHADDVVIRIKSS